MNHLSARKLSLLIVLALFLAQAPPVSGLKAGRVIGAVLRADLIFTGTVVMGRGSGEIVFTVDKVYKGEVADTVAVWRSPASYAGFYPGESYLVFVHRDRYLWGHGEPLEEAGEALVELNSLPVTGPAEKVDRALIDRAIANLAAEADSVRREATLLLGGAHGYADLVIPALSRLYETGDHHDRWNALSALPRFDDHIAEVEPILRAALADTSAELRWAALSGLRRLKVGKTPALDLIVLSLDDPSELVRSCTFTWSDWNEIPADTALSLLRRALRDPSFHVRSSALREIATVGDHAPELISVDELSRAWKDSLMARWALLDAFAKMADWTGDVEPLLQHLRLAVRDPDPQVREHALYVLGDETRLHERSEAGEVFATAIQDPEPSVREAALYMYGQACSRIEGTLGMGHDWIQARLIEATEDTAEAVRTAAIEALTRFGYPEEVVPVCIRVVGAGDDVVWWHAFYYLQRHLADTDLQVLALAALQDPDDGVRATALSSLQDLGDPVILRPHLVHALNDSSAQVRNTALSTLARLDSAEESLSYVVAALNDPDEYVRRTAVKCLSGLGPPAMLSLPKLNEMLATERYPNRVAIRQAIREIDGADETR